MLDRSALEATAAPLLSPSRAAARRKRIGTAKLGNRDKRDPLPAIGPELAVSGSDSAVPSQTSSSPPYPEPPTEEGIAYTPPITPCAARSGAVSDPSENVDTIRISS